MGDEYVKAALYGIKNFNNNVKNKIKEERETRELEEKINERFNEIVVAEIEKYVKSITSADKAELMLENEKLRQIVKMLVREKYPDIKETTIMGINFDLRS